MTSKDQLEAFEKYDFGGDDRWINYYNNLTIPPGRSDGAAIVRRYKQKFYQKFVDPDFVVQTLSEAAKDPANASSSSSSSQSASSTRYRAASDPPPARSAPPDQSPSNNPGRQQPPGTDWETFQFLASAFIIIMAVVSMFPFAPATIAARCFSLCLMGSFFTSVIGIHHKYGLPRAWTLDAARYWLQNISTGPEFLAIMHCGAFLPSPRPVILAVVPVACHLGPGVAEYLQRRVSRAQIYRSYLEKPCTWLTTNRTLVNLFAANMEISLGFLVIVYLFTPQRNFLLLFFYWQILKLEFHSPATAWYHRQVWSTLGAKVEPVLQSYVPALLAPLGYAKQWFNTVPGAQ